MSRWSEVRRFRVKHVMSTSYSQLGTVSSVFEHRLSFGELLRMVVARTEALGVGPAVRGECVGEGYRWSWERVTPGGLRDHETLWVVRADWN